MATEIQPTELKSRIDKGEKFLLLDVRQQWEYDTAKIPNAKLIPMNELAQRLDEIKLAPDETLVAYCHGGVRSMRSAIFLEQSGFKSVLSLAGGIAAWSSQIDPSIPQY